MGGVFAQKCRLECCSYKNLLIDGMISFSSAGTILIVEKFIVYARMTLLLGPPGAGKSTLLLALAGKLDKSLRVCFT